MHFWSMLCIAKGKENAYGRDEEPMRQDPGGTAHKGAAGNRGKGDQHTAVYTTGH